jgi:hypothetical protein
MFTDRFWDAIRQHSAGVIRLRCLVLLCEVDGQHRARGFLVKANAGRGPIRLVWKGAALSVPIWRATEHEFKHGSSELGVFWPLRTV